MNINKKIFINTLSKNINNSKVNGIFDNKLAFTLNMLNYYRTFTYNNLNYVNQFDNINTLIKYLKLNKNICKIRVKLSSYINTVTSVVNTLTSTLKNISTNTTKVNIFNNGVLYDAYKFNLTDIKYSDTQGKIYNQLSINRTNLQDGFLKVYFGPDPEDYFIYGEDFSWLTISKDNITNITYFTSSTTDFLHSLSIKTYTEFEGTLIPSNIASLTVNRTNFNTSNQSATIGDTAIKTNNRVTTTLTLEMFTSNLTPPYNDPENDLIDAIRIDEISTANLGKFYLNNVEITDGQIITREDLIAELFTHEGPNVNTIETDAFNFSARDEGSQQWVQ